jgi:hypothetical protein
MPYTNGDGSAHDRRTCRRLHNTGGRIRQIDAAGDRDACPNCADGPDSDARTPTDTDDDRTDAERDIAGLIDMGVCPWCPSDTDREFQNVGAHAAQVHADEWQAYRDA